MDAIKQNNGNANLHSGKQNGFETNRNCSNYKVLFTLDLRNHFRQLSLFHWKRRREQNINERPRLCVSRRPKVIRSSLDSDIRSSRKVKRKFCLVAVDGRRNAISDRVGQIKWPWNYIQLETGFWDIFISTSGIIK